MRTTEEVALFLVLSIIGHSKVWAICSGEYGAEPCRFIPAPPGRTPNCARPGLTYCEHPSHYPGQLIQYLIDKWRYDHTSLLSNETPEEFNSYFIPVDGMYGPRVAYGPPNTLHDYAPEPIYIPKPSYPIFQQPGNTYIPPPPDVAHNYSDGFLGYPDRRYNLQHELPNNQLYNHKVANGYVPVGPPQVTYYTPYDWWKRHSRDVKKTQSDLARRKRRSLHMYSRLQDESSLKNVSTPHRRIKRQGALVGQPLCEIRTQYIMPRAALNNKGNWMYVVNMPDADSRYTQLVKSETCASSECSGLCSVPAGYTSRCEQKYIQKRLVALEGTGNRLYTDIFWFPSCCVCTLTR